MRKNSFEFCRKSKNHNENSKLIIFINFFLSVLISENKFSMWNNESGIVCCVLRSTFNNLEKRKNDKEIEEYSVNIFGIQAMSEVCQNLIL